MDCAEQRSDGVPASIAMEERRSSIADGTLDPSSALAWMPRAGMAFRPYVSPQSCPPGTPVKSGSGHVAVRRPLVTRLTNDIAETFQICDPGFKYPEDLIPKRFLTNPSVGVLNDGNDNENSDLILHVNSVLVNLKDSRRYVVKDMLGQGTFGQVAKCWDAFSSNYIAVKVIKNQPAYYQQALVEVSILDMLNQKFDPDDQHHIVRVLDYFVYQNHLCITFEMLGPNLYELIKMNGFKGLPLNYVQNFSKQILQALLVMKDAGIIHCDLKPENILVCPRVRPPEIKVIDFGSACMEGRTIYSYIQSRYYRSPEVLLGYPYSTAIDMWSFGCIVAELFLGLPLFPGASEYDLLERMIEILGGQPPDHLLRDAKNTARFFKHVGSIYPDGGSCIRVSSAYQVLTEEEYEARESKKPSIGKRYFGDVKLEDIIVKYPCKKNLPKEEILKESSTRMALVDFLRGLVEFDPEKRWSPLQASYHPFLTGEPFTRPYKPFPETPRIPVFHTAAVDHHPGGGHWLAAGLSPQIGNVNRCLPFGSPRFTKMPFSYGSSYGSLGSHGSYNDNAGPGSNYGSYGDANTASTYYSALGPGGFNLYSQIGGSFLGSSPDVTRRPQLSYGNGSGFSPGSLGAMSLGASPSQFTPPSSQMQISSASPVKYGPPSPVRNFHGTALGKAAAVGQYSRKSNLGHLPMSMPPHESSSQHGTGHYPDSISSSHPDMHIRGLGYSHKPPSNSSHHHWRQQIGGSGLSTGAHSSRGAFPASQVHDVISPRSSDVSSDKAECSSLVPDPADWDPNYSDESLLQEDNSEVRSLSHEFENRIHIGNMGTEAFHSGAGRFGHGQSQAPQFVLPAHRADQPSLASSFGESSHSTFNYAHADHGFSYNFQQIFPSQYGQQSVQWFNPVNPNYMQRNHQNGQPGWINYSMVESHSTVDAVLASGMPWGRRAGHSIATALPSSQAQEDYGRIL